MGGLSHLYEPNWSTSWCDGVGSRFSGQIHPNGSQYSGPSRVCPKSCSSRDRLGFLSDPEDFLGSKSSPWGVFQSKPNSAGVSSVLAGDYAPSVQYALHKRRWKFPLLSARRRRYWRSRPFWGWSVHERFFVPSVRGESEVEFEDGIRWRQPMEEKERTPIMESGNSNKLDAEGHANSIEASKILRMEATSVLDLGRKLGLSYGSNEFELLQQVLSWEADEACVLTSIGLEQKTPSKEGDCSVWQYRGWDCRV